MDRPLGWGASHPPPIITATVPRFSPKLLEVGALKRLGNKADDFKANIPINYVIEYLHEQFEIIQKNLLVFKSGTGTGKSLLLPTHLCSYFKKNVILAVPLVQVAKDVPKNIAKVYANDYVLGENIGYKTGQDSFPPKEIPNVLCVTYAVCTLVLNNFTEEDFSNTIIIVDEAHSTNLEELIILQVQLKDIISRYKSYRIIYTSASLEAGKFKTYLEDDEVVKKHGFEAFYGEALGVSGNLEVIKPTSYIPTKKEILLNAFNVLFKEGNAIVFCSGQKEIEEVFQILQGVKFKLKPIFILASSTNLRAKTYNTQLIEQEPMRNTCHVIIATNAIEVGFTAPNVTLCVDFCTEFKSKNMPGFFMEPVVKIVTTGASRQQRLGRAGRTTKGIGIAVITDDAVDHTLYSTGILTTNNLKNLILRMVIQLPAELKNKKFAFTDPINFNALVSDYDFLVVNGLVAETGLKITAKGQQVYQLIQGSIGVEEAAFLVTALSNGVPILVATMFIILIGERKLAYKKADNETSLKAFIKFVIEQCVNPLAQKQDSVFTFFRIVTSLCKIGVKFDYKANEITPKMADVLYERIYKTCCQVYKDQLLFLNKHKSHYEMPSGIRFASNRVQQFHLAQSRELPSKLLCIKFDVMPVNEMVFYNPSLVDEYL